MPVPVTRRFDVGSPRRGHSRSAKGGGPLKPEHGTSPRAWGEGLAVPSSRPSLTRFRLPESATRTTRCRRRRTCCTKSGTTRGTMPAIPHLEASRREDVHDQNSEEPDRGRARDAPRPPAPAVYGGEDNRTRAAERVYGGDGENVVNVVHTEDSPTEGRKESRCRNTPTGVGRRGGRALAGRW